jgi:hypothetical protein
MALRSYQLVLAAAAQRLSNVYGGASLTDLIDANEDIAYRQILLQAESADAFVGMDETVTSTVYGTKVDSTDLQPVTLGPFPTGPIKLSDLWVAGAGATIHVTGIPF